MTMKRRWGKFSHVGPSHEISPMARNILGLGDEPDRKLIPFGMLQRSFLVPRAFSSITKDPEYDHTTERGEGPPY
jgi:hypothetical protein